MRQMPAMQDPLSNYTVEQLAKLPPDQAEALYYQAAEYRRRQQEQQRAQAEKDAKGSVGNDLINTGAGLAGTIGGLYAADAILNKGSAVGNLLGSGSSAGSTLAGGSTVGTQVADKLPMAYGTQVADVASKGGTTAAGGLGIAPYLGLGGAVFGGAGLASNMADRKKDPVGGALSGGALGGGLAAAAPLLGFAALGPLGLLGAVAAGGLLGGAGGMFGNSRNYFDAKARHDMLAKVTGDKTKPLTFSGGQSLLPQDFAKNPETYNYDQSAPTMERDISISNPLAFALTGEKNPTGKRLTDLSGAIANLSRQGVGADEIYSKFGMSADDVRSRIANSQDLDAQVRAAYLGGLDRTFGPQSSPAPQQPTMPVATVSPEQAAGMAERITESKTPGWWNKPGNTIATKKPSSEELNASKKMETIRKALAGMR